MSWADAYSYEDDRIPEEVGRRAKTRGWFTKGEFMRICKWKTPRTQDHCKVNREPFIKWATRLALSSPHEEGRIRALMMLQGVKWPTASVILHFAHRSPYPILDYRALWSLGFPEPPKHDFAFWWDYTTCCRRLASRYKVSMRTLDRALWQYSKIHQRS